MSQRELVFYDAQGVGYQPVKHGNRQTGRSAYRVKPPGASNRTEDFIELDTIEELAKAMLVDGLPARVKAINGNGPVSVLRFGADVLRRYELEPALAARLGIPAQSGADIGRATSPLNGLRARFLAAFPDFESVGAFAATTGAYHDTYRKRVDALLAAAAQHPADGWAVLKNVLAASQGGRGALPPFFDGDVNWRVPRARDVDPASFDAALDALVAGEDDPAAAAVSFNETFRAALNVIGVPNTFRDTRVVPSTVLAAVAPDRAISVRYQLYANAERMLNDRTLFATKPMSVDEYRAVLALAEQIRAAMIDWGWAPRDLWDVHGFVLATCGKQKDADMDDATLLARFRRNALFRAVQERWSPEQTAAFCTIARAVHAAGLDWYFVNIADRPVRFGRKAPSGRNAQAVLGTVEGSGRPRVWFRKNDAALDLGVDDIFLDAPGAERFAELLEREREAIAAWFPPDPKRPGCWPDEYGDDMEKDQDVASGSGNVSAAPTNLILYGPPGTGKTYATRRRAVALCGEDASGDDADVKARYEKLVEASRIRFVTFHQSYAYEDFVEGLRPPTGAQGEGAGGFRLEVRPGVFREIATLAERATEAARGGNPFDIGDRQVFKMSLGRAGAEDHIFDAAVEGGYIVLGWGGEIDWSPYDSYEAIHARWNEDHPGTNGNDGNIIQVARFRANMKKGDLVVVSYGNTRYRAIGEITGDYEYLPTETRDYSHRRAVKWLHLPETPQPVTFYDRPFTMRSCYLLDEAHLHRAALALLLPGTGGAPVAPKPFVLICDEINRANISKVFGELITLLEADKRLGRPNALRVQLPYSGDSFGVPANLHVIGTMNTADRSIALLDTALRRRFTFEELMPNPGLLAEAAGRCGIDLPRLLATLNDRIEYLFDREHQIGHAYFMHCRTRDDVGEVMRHKVIPLLAEYFYEDWSRVAAVLGDLFPDDGKAHSGDFLDRRPLKSPFADSEGATRYRWTVRDPAHFAYAKLTAAA